MVTVGRRDRQPAALSGTHVTPNRSIGCFDAGIEVVGPPGLRPAFERLAVRYAAAAG